MTSSPLHDVADSIMGRCRAVMESAVHDGKDFIPMTMCYRGDTEVAMVMSVADGNRDAMLTAAGYAATGFSADTIALAFDGWCAAVPLNPRTGREWGPGELAESVQHYDALASGEVGEALTVHVGNRAEDMLVLSMPYKRITGISGNPKYTRQSVRWLPEQATTFDTSDANAQFGGVIPNALREIMSRPTMLAEMGVHLPMLEGVSFEVRQTLADIATARLLLGTMDCAVMLPAEQGSERAKLIVEMLGDIALVEPWSDN